MRTSLFYLKGGGVLPYAADRLMRACCHRVSHIGRSMKRAGRWSSRADNPTRCLTFGRNAFVPTGHGLGPFLASKPPIAVHSAQSDLSVHPSRLDAAALAQLACTYLLWTTVKCLWSRIAGGSGRAGTAVAERWLSGTYTSTKARSTRRQRTR